MQRHSTSQTVVVAAPPPSSSAISQADEENYYSAQRAAVEAVDIGRATLEQTQLQGEQLQNAQSIGVETQYKLDKAGRLLRGMTWPGWVANLVTPDVTTPQPPAAENKTAANVSWWSRSNDSQTGTVRHHHHQQQRQPPLVYECDDENNDNENSVPSKAYPLAQAIQNYHANLNVLQSCETSEQRETCLTICQAMYRTALQQLYALRQNLESQVIANDDDNRAKTRTSVALKRLREDLELLRERHTQLEKQHHQRRDDHNPYVKTSSSSTLLPSSSAVSQQQAPHQTPISNGPQSRAAASVAANQKELFSSRAPYSASTVSTTAANNNSGDGLILIQQQQEKQDSHLEFLGRHLTELGALSGTLHTALADHQERLDQLDAQSESILDQTRRVTRRADRLVTANSWSMTLPTPKHVLGSAVWIRHVASGKWLSVVKSDLYLVATPPKYGPESCLFDVYARQKNAGSQTTSLFGLKNRLTNKWLGQNMLGSLSCSATSYGRREEWEADEDDWWSKLVEKNKPGPSSTRTSTTTRLLCASAGWGYGGYLMVRKRDLAVSIGGSTLEDKKHADLWEIIVREDG